MFIYERRRRLHAGQLLDKVEGGVGVRVREFDDLVVIVLHTLNHLRIAVLDEIGCFSRGCVYFSIGVTADRMLLYKRMSDGVLERLAGEGALSSDLQ
jgi:hypothetical protein